MRKSRVYKEFATIDKDILLKIRFYMSFIFGAIMIIPHLNYPKFGIDFNFMDFIHSDSNISLVYGMFLGIFIALYMAVIFLLEKIVEK